MRTCQKAFSLIFAQAILFFFIILFFFLTTVMVIQQISIFQKMCGGKLSSKKVGTFKK